jgi:hypothetical protein
VTVFQASTLTWSGGSAQNLAGLTNIAASEYDLHVRALSADIYLGNAGVSGASTGFLLIQDKDYVFRLHNIPGTNQDNQPYVWQGSGSNKSLTYALVPVG